MKTILKYLKTKKTQLILSSFIIMLSCAKDDSCEYDGFPFDCDKGMDIAFVIDYTGSMGPAIDNIKANITSILTTIEVESSFDYRLSLSIFDEYEQAGVTPTYLTQPDYTSLPASQKIVNNGVGTDQYLTMMEVFSANNKASFTTQLNKLNNTMSLGSGVGFPEPGGLLTDQVVDPAKSFAGNWRNGVTKLLFIITDAPAGGDDDTADATDDSFLSGLGTLATSEFIQCVLVTSQPSSNYEYLINNNALGVKQLATNFNDGSLANQIKLLLESICDSNSNK